MAELVAHESLLGLTSEENSVVVGGAIGFRMPYGTVGPWKKADLQQVNGPKGTDWLATLKEAGLKPDISSSREREDGSLAQVAYYTVARKAEADAAAKLLNPKVFGSRLITQFELLKDDALPVGQFDNVWNIEKKGFATNQSEPYQLVFLVSLVRAYAEFRGWDVPEISFEDISDPRNMGDLATDEIKRQKYWDSLMLQRVELWKALGEEEVRASVAKGAKDAKGKEMTGKNVATSDNLSEALAFATHSWTGKFYVAMGRCGNPYGGTIPTVVKFFINKKDAQEYVDARSAGRVATDDTEATLTPAVDEFAGLYVPQSFLDEGLSKEDFASAVGSEFAEILNNVKTSTGIEKAKAEKVLKAKLGEYSLTLDQLHAWAAKLGL